MKKFVYIFFGLFLVISFVTSYKIISGNYDKQNLFIIKIKEIIPTQLKNKLRVYINETRISLNQDKIKKKQEAKFKQGLNGELIQSTDINSEVNLVKYNVREFFLPFKRLDLSYGWQSVQNSKRAHYFDFAGDKTVVASGEGNFIFFDTKNFNSKKLYQKRLESNLIQFLKDENFTFIGLRDMLIDKNKLYLSVVLQDVDENYTLSILSAELNYQKLIFEFFFKTELLISNFSIGTGGRIVSFKDNKLLFTIGHLGFIDEIQMENHLSGKIISISKEDGSFDLISKGHRNHQGLFYHIDEFENQFIINSEHGPKGGDEININNLKDNKVQNFGWPISSYGINYDGTNPYKSSHKDYGFKEPLKYFTPSIGISEISLKSKKDFNEIYASSLRAHSIYIVKSDKIFSRVLNTDRLILDYRIRDIKFSKSLNGFIVIFENTPSIGFIKSYD